MNEEIPTPVDLSSLGMDLARSFQPAWAQEADTPERLAKLAERHGGGEPERYGRGGQGRNDNRSPQGRDKRPFSNDRARRPERKNEQRPERPAGGQNPRQGGAPQENRPRGGREGHQDRRPHQDPGLQGWDVRIQSDDRGIVGLARQIKTSLKTYPLFDLAHLVLEKPDRYQVTLTQTGGPNLWQLTLDGSVWLREEDALGHVLRDMLDRFYIRETITMEPPKGNFTSIAQCGMSDILLGPSSHHDYPAKIRSIHNTRFSHVPFDVYQSRIRMVKDEALIAKWKEEQSVREVFRPLPIVGSESAEVCNLANMAEVERHFRANHWEGLLKPVGNRCRINGTAATQSAPQICQLVRSVWEQLQRFPLPLANSIGQALSNHGVQIFKAHENITYASVSRPRYLDRVASPISAHLAEIMDYLERNPKATRMDQWKGLLELRPIANESESKARDTAVAADLTWLVHEGYVMDYAGRSLELPRPSKPQPPREKKKPQEGKPPAPKTPQASPVAVTEMSVVQAKEPAIAPEAPVTAVEIAPVAQPETIAPILQESPIVETPCEQPVNEQPAEQPTLES